MEFTVNKQATIANAWIKMYIQSTVNLMLQGFIDTFMNELNLCTGNTHRQQQFENFAEKKMFMNFK